MRDIHACSQRRPLIEQKLRQRGLVDGRRRIDMVDEYPARLDGEQ